MAIVDLLLIVALLLALAALASSKVAECVRIVAAQGIAMGLLLVAAHRDDLTLQIVVLAALTVALKGFVIPWFLFRSIREAKVQNEVEPYIGFALSVVFGAVAVAIAFALAGLLPLPLPSQPHLIVPVSLATVFLGMLLLVSRRKAVTQVLGYIVLENGIFIFSMSLARELPLLIEMGVLLDIFVGAFVMGITIYQINREFDHIDVDRLQELSELSSRRRRIHAVHEREASGEQDM
ncbi:MAG: hydrogenase [Dehalococcoidia bacterium]|nr:hydrogenase [Dehalococcoidia bacterium]